MSKVKLSEVAKVELSSIDKKISSDEISVKLCNFTDIYYNWAITKDIIESCMDGSVKETEYKKLSLKKGQVAITKDSETRDDIGISCYISNNFENAVLGYHCALITPIQDRLNGKYLNALLNTTYARKCFVNNASGSGQRFTLSKEAIENIKITLPTLNKQKKIGSFFSDIDKKIQNNKKQIETLESLAKTIYDYWLVQFDFPNEDGKPYKSSGGMMVWNEDLKMEIPGKWNCIKLGNIFSFIKGKIPNELLEKKEHKLKPYITIDVANGGIPMYCSPESMPYCNSETIMVMDGASSGNVYVGIDGVLGSTFSMLKSSREDISNSYIYMILNTLKSVYVRANTGSTVPHANRRYIEQMKIAIPKNCLFFSKTFDEIFYQIKLLNLQIKELNSLKTFLLPLLFNGQVII